MEMMYSQNNENGIFEVLKIKTFFPVQPWWTYFIRIFVKFSPWVLHWWHLSKVIEKSKNSLIYCSHYLDTRSLRDEIRNSKTNNIP